MGNARGVLVTAACRVGASPADYCARMVANEKWCRLCRAWHDIDAFGADAHRTDGRASACRESKNRRERELYAARGQSAVPAPKIIVTVSSSTH